MARRMVQDAISVTVFHLTGYLGDLPRCAFDPTPLVGMAVSQWLFAGPMAETGNFSSFYLV
jgi:hypothetical protein